MLNQTHNEACEFTMSRMPADYIDLVVTSPPYDDLRAYNGFSFNFDNIAAWLWYVIKPGGCIVWVVGDATVKGSETGTSFRQALRFMDLGFKLHDTMIYRKDNYMPLNHNRYDPEFEFMFVLSKGRPKTFNPLLTACKTAGETYNYKGRTSASTKDGSAMRKRDEDKLTKETKYRGNIWSYATGKNKGSKDDIWLHPATFPEALAEDHVLSWSNPGDIVYDPFMGSGTTAKMALTHGRNFIGSEISAEYCAIIDERLKPFRV